jgi:hypothetical protein
MIAKRKKVKEIFKIIKQQSLLNYPNFNENFELITDRSDIGVGGFLKQAVNGIGMYSAKYTNAQKN